MEGEGNGKEMEPWSKMEHQVAGSGQEAFEADPLCAGMALLIDWARDGREGSQVPPEAPQTTQIYNGQEGEWSRLGPSPTALSHFTVQTARVIWLHPNKQANTANSLVHNKLDRHNLHMKTLDSVSAGYRCLISAYSIAQH